MTTSALIAARMGSSRFPGKTLTDLHGKPMLERMVERVRACERISDIMLATTDLEEDDRLESWAGSIGIKCFRGSADDVLLRLRTAAEAGQMQTIVEMLGDNPLVHSDLIDSALDLFKTGSFDYVATVTNEYPNADPVLARFPIGVRVQVFSMETLLRCDRMATAPENREHATSFIAEHPELFRTGFVEATGSFADLCRPELTFAVNHRENLDLIRRIYDACYETDPNFDLANAIRAFDARPEIHQLMGAQNGG